MERIGFVHKNKIDLKFGVNEIDNTSKDIFFGDRNLIEENTEFVQPIGAAMVLTKMEKVF